MRKAKPVINMAVNKPNGRNAGKLAWVMDAPVDVVFEIVSHLQPKDVLQLTRVSKDLRSLLLSKSSRSVWVAALENVVPPLPQCPVDMSEPHYAFLVFERFCQLCGQDRAQNVDYAIRVRLCGNCWRSKAEKGTELGKTLQLQRQRAIKDVLYTLVPRGTRSWSSTEYDDGVLQSLDQKEYHWYYSPQFLPVARHYLALRKAGNQAALEQFVKERQADTLERRNFHRTLLGWESESSSIKQESDSNAQTERITEIYDKLRQLGYDDPDFPEHNLDWDQMLEQPKRLTPRIWNTIRPKLIAIIENERKAEFRLKWTKRREQLRAHYARFLWQGRGNVEIRTLPSPTDAVELPCMKGLMTAEEPDVDLSEDKFLAIRDALLLEGGEYRARVKRELAKKLAALHNPEPASSSEPPRKRRRVAGASLVAKGKQVETSGPEMDPEVERELLENPNSIFNCSPYRNLPVTACDFHMSYLGLMEHRQNDHDAPWDVQKAHVPEPGVQYHDLDAEFAKRLLSALGMRDDATHSEIDELLQSGRPRCSCGKNPNRYNSLPQWLMLGALIQHLELPRQRSPSFGLMSSPQTGSTGAIVEHHITFEPYETQSDVGASADAGRVWRKESLGCCLRR